MGWFWPTSSCPEISGQPAQKRILQPGDFCPGLPPDAPETPQEGGDRLKIEPSNQGIFAVVSQRLRDFAQSPGHDDVPPLAAVLRPAKKNRPLQERTEQDIDKSHTGGYTENRKGAAGRRLAPHWITEVTADCGDRLGGYFFLLLCTCKNRPQMPMITKQN